MVRRIWIGVGGVLLLAGVVVAARTSRDPDGELKAPTQATVQATEHTSGTQADFQAGILENLRRNPVNLEHLRAVAGLGTLAEAAMGRPRSAACETALRKAQTADALYYKSGSLDDMNAALTASRMAGAACAR